MNHTSFLGVGGAVLGVLMGSLIIKLEKIGVACRGIIRPIQQIFGTIELHVCSSAELSKQLFCCGSL